MNGKECRLCSVRPAAFLCFCQEAFLCSECIGHHLLNNPLLDHKPVPLASSELIKTMRSESPKKSAAGKDSAYKSVAQQVLAREMQRLEDFESKAMLKLSAVKQLWSAQLERAVQEVREQISDQVLKLSQMLQDCMSEASAHSPQPFVNPLREQLNQISPEDELLQLSLDIKSLELVSIVKKSLPFETDLVRSGKDQGFLYKFFGGSNVVGVFDVKSETVLAPITATRKFFHNACWTLTPTGNVFLTGGSLTGKSRAEAIEFNPTNGRVNEMQPMHVARRSHASICRSARYYAFGGILEEERISMCEQYNPQDDTWSPLANMIERRAYLGCCDFHGAIYVGGGCEQSSIEIFDMQSNEFQLALLPEVPVEDNCSLLALEDSILIFHGNFKGEVSRLLSNHQARKERDVCYGNSWSNCQPVKHGDTVYMLRSDSVFSYSLRTCISAYVVHLSKINKRKEYE